MNIEIVREQCLALEGATEDMAFGPENLLFRICGKIFACLDLERPYLVVLKCDPDYAVELRDAHNGITGAWHWNKTYWNDVRFDADVDDALILQLIRHAYDEVVKTLPKKTLYNFPDLPDGWAHSHFAVTDTLMNHIRHPEFFDRPSPFVLLTADRQTAGRGQRGTAWEAENAKNLLLAFRFRPDKVPASQQFLLSQAVAVAAREALGKYIKEDLRIKWPNDIYYKDKKLAGMLIEHDICGAEIAATVVGIGFNVNQETFASDAPTPISVRQILGKEIDRAALLRNFLKVFDRYAHLDAENLKRAVGSEYIRRLYRLGGVHPYRDAKGTFRAKISDIGKDGRLLLKDTDGSLRSYTFKEVEFILEK